MQYTPPQFLYHITRTNFGKRWRPGKLLATSIDRPDDEPRVARLCVCPTVSGCISAVLGMFDSFWVYRTMRKCRGVIPWKVCDSKITGEQWLLQPVTFIRVGRLNKELVDEIESHNKYCYDACGDDDLLKEQKLCLQKAIRPTCKKYGWS